MTKSPLRILFLASLGAVALAGCGETKTDQTKEQDVIAKVAAPAGKPWSQTVATTADGGHVMGNPDAPIKVIEFASLTWPFEILTETSSFWIVARLVIVPAVAPLGLERLPRMN